MRIQSIKKVGRKPVYDLSLATDVYNKQHYVLKNGVVTHNTGIYLSSDTIWIIGRQQDKVGTEVQGYHFVINVEKSRHVKEKSKIPISVTWEGGIAKWSGLLEVAEKGGYIRKPKMGWYEPVNPETGEVLSDKLLRAKEIVDNGKFWNKMFEQTNFADYIKNAYTVGGNIILRDDEELDIQYDEEDDTEE
jgi:hypothetical protein